LMRLNTTTNQFEGYQNSNWQGLGGVIDVDQDTYVSTEKTSDDDILFFYTAGSERARLTSAGLFGIGVTSPDVRLHVETSAADVLSKFINSDGTNGHGLLVKAGGSASGKYIATFRDAANNTRMHLLADGKVGIGTATPSVQLQTTGDVIVGGNLTVSGTTFTVDTSNVLV